MRLGAMRVMPSSKTARPKCPLTPRRVYWARAFVLSRSTRPRLTVHCLPARHSPASSNLLQVPDLCSVSMCLRALLYVLRRVCEWMCVLF